MFHETQISCSCPDNGGMMERIALYSPGSQTIGSSLFLTKNTPTNGTQLTNIVGIENDAGTSNVTLVSTASFPFGEPMMDDSPKVNESWSDGAGDASTITTVGGTLILPNGEQIINVASDQWTGNFTTITWGFAKGVGFTSIGLGTQNTTLASFTINAASSLARTAHAVEIAHGAAGKSDPAAALSVVFK